MGAMTGRAAGFCGGAGMPGYANVGPGRGFGMGYGWGRGFGGGRGARHTFRATGLPGWMRLGTYSVPSGRPAWYQNPDPEMERAGLRNQADILQSQLDSIRKRLSEIETGTAEE